MGSQYRESVQQGSDRGLVGVDPGQHEQRGRPASTNPSPPGVIGTIARAIHNIGQQDQSRADVGADCVQRRDQGRIVEQPVGRGVDKGSMPSAGERGRDLVPLDDQCGRGRICRDLATNHVDQAPRDAADHEHEPVPGEHHRAECDDDDREQERDQQPELELTGRGRTDDHRGHGEDGQGEQHSGAHQIGGGEGRRDDGSGLPSLDQDLALDDSASCRSTRQHLGRCVPTTCDVATAVQDVCGSATRSRAQVAAKLANSSTNRTPNHQGRTWPRSGQAPSRVIRLGMTT